MGTSSSEKLSEAASDRVIENSSSDGGGALQPTGRTRTQAMQWDSDGQGNGAGGGGGSGQGGGSGSSNNGGSSPYERLEQFAVAAQQVYLFDDVPVHLVRYHPEKSNGQPSHAFAHYDNEGAYNAEASRGPWTGNKKQLEPFEAADVRREYVSTYAEELRKLRDTKKVGSGKYMPEEKNTIKLNGSIYKVIMYYRRENNKDLGKYYESTIFKMD